MGKHKKTYKTNNSCRCNTKIKILEKKIKDTGLRLASLENNLIRNSCYVWHRLKKNLVLKKDGVSINIAKKRSEKKNKRILQINQRGEDKSYYKIT